MLMMEMQEIGIVTGPVRVLKARAASDRTWNETPPLRVDQDRRSNRRRRRKLLRSN
jgi:hypothetical protein